MHVIILEKSTCVPYFYTRINVIKCKESYLTTCWAVVHTVFQLQPFEGSRDADVAHCENEFHTPALGRGYLVIDRWRP